MKMFFEIIFFQKKVLGQMNHLGPKSDASPYLWIRCKKIFKTLHNEKGQ